MKQQPPISRPMPGAQTLTPNVVSIARAPRVRRTVEKKISLEAVILIAGLVMLFLGFVVGFIIGQAVTA